MIKFINVPWKEKPWCEMEKVEPSHWTPSNFCFINFVANALYHVSCEVLADWLGIYFEENHLWNQLVLSFAVMFYPFVPLSFVNNCILLDAVACEDTSNLVLGFLLWILYISLYFLFCELTGIEWKHIDGK